MDFTEATKLAKRWITDADIAEACGVAVVSVRSARLDPASDSSRPPPKGWEKALAKLLRERAKGAEQLAEELEGLR